MRKLSGCVLLVIRALALRSSYITEEFGIYLNYVRKLGFEETPDYEFLRELFGKVLKNNGDVEDGVYDWNLLNGAYPPQSCNHVCIQPRLCRWQGLGSLSCKSYIFTLALHELNLLFLQGQNQILAQIQNTPATPAHDRRREANRDDRRRTSQQQAGGPGAVLPPSPAMVRQGSRQQQSRQVPQALLPGGGNAPGQATLLSTAAHVDVPMGSSNRRMSQPGTPQHPYANAGYDSYGRGETTVDEYSATQQQYGRASPMVSSVGAAPPAVSNVRAMGGEHGVANGGDFHGQATDERPKNTLWQILTCKCG